MRKLLYDSDNINECLNNSSESSNSFWKAVYFVCDKYCSRLTKHLSSEDKADVIQDVVADLFEYKLKKYDADRGVKATFIKVCAWQLTIKKLMKITKYKKRQKELIDLAERYWNEQY